MKHGTNDLAKPSKIEVSKTAKPVLAVKYITAKPTFWKEKGYGSRSIPLIHNECAALLLKSEDIKKAETRADIKQIKTVSTRDRWINKCYQKYIKEKGYKQIVILGSGFDIRPYKKSPSMQKDKKNAAVYAQLKFWEIDQADVLDEKEAIFTANGLDKNATYIRTDYTKGNFIEALIATELDARMATLFIWEGNSMYLEKEQIIDVLFKLKQSFKEFTIIFDYFKQITIDTLDSNSPLKGLWKTGIDDIHEFAAQNGLSINENRNLAELEIEYDVDTNPCERATQYSICSLGHYNKM